MKVNELKTRLDEEMRELKEKLQTTQRIARSEGYTILSKIIGNTVKEIWGE